MSDETTTPEAIETPAPITVQEAGRRGGNQVKARYGTEFYAEIGHKGGNSTKKKHGPEFYAEIGRRGGKANLEKNGLEALSRAGKVGGAKVRDLVAKGKQQADGPAES